MEAAALKVSLTERENLREELELQSSDRENTMSRAFSTALEMQQNTEEEANALKTELEWTTRNNQQEMNELVEQVTYSGLEVRRN